jgi:ethanolamine ammonia-lyase small subunit
MSDIVPKSHASAPPDPAPDATPSIAVRLRALTPARVALGRTGVSLATRDLLDFQACHARARDAVHASLESAALAATLTALTGSEVLRLHSAAPDRATYLQRPDLGRMLDESSQSLLADRTAPERSAANSQDIQNESPDAQYLALIVTEGLSALAVERHAAPLLAELLPRLEGWHLAPLCIVEQGRVAISDPIGAALGAQISAILLGERPGLNSSDSLGVYVTHDPRPGRTDAERTCISNIRPEGLGYAQAAAELACILTEVSRLRLTGIGLKQATRQIQKG